MSAGLAAAANILMAHSSAGIGLQMVLGKEANNLSCSSARLGNSLRNILGALAHAGKENACSRTFHRTQLRMGLHIKIIIINASSQHGSQLARIRRRFHRAGQHY